MSVRIALDNPQTLYTNLDYISGQAILSLRSNETIATITVKLEGESKSRLIGDPPVPQGYGVVLHRRSGRDETTIETEVHKVSIISVHRHPVVKWLTTSFLHVLCFLCILIGTPMMRRLPCLSPPLSFDLLIIRCSHHHLPSNSFKEC